MAVRRPTATRRWLTAASWPIGVAITSWGYMWRSTPLHRHETARAASESADPATTVPGGISREDVQDARSGHGPLFRRRYRTRIRGTAMSARELMAAIQKDLNRPAPSAFARFQKVCGRPGELQVGDEYVVRMPGPWDGPVRVIERTPQSFRLATLDGHLEAGQIVFSARDDDRRHEGDLTFEIESIARSSTRMAHLLYHRLRMSKEIQAHMWISFLEGVAKLAGGRMQGGVWIDTERVEASRGR